MLLTKAGHILQKNQHSACSIHLILFDLVKQSVLDEEKKL
jgi:hypothetical protein